MPDGPKLRHLVRPTMLSGLCVMVPVPFLDEILLRRVRKGMIVRIFADRGVGIAPGAIRPIYAGESKGCLATAVGLVVKGITTIFRKLLRTVLFFLAIRASALEMAETYLIGRTLDRLLSERKAAENSFSRDEAEHVRQAFAEVVSGTDRRLLSQVMKTGWKHVGGIRHLGRVLGQRFRKGNGKDASIQPEDLGAEERAAIERGSEDIERELEKQEVRSFLADFDARFDEALARLA